MYSCDIRPDLALLLRNYTLSDDIAFRFSDRGWASWPLTADTYAGWLADALQTGDVVNLFMDYETFGEHQKADSGIFDFLAALPAAVLSKGLSFRTPSQVASECQPVAPLHVTYPISWADEERDTSAWLGNELQEEAFSKVCALEKDVARARDAKLTAAYRKLQESDHFYYMCTKFFSDGSVHSYFNPYDTPYEAFINYMNVLSDFEIRVKEKIKENNGKQSSSKA